jgi:hypothetical protein
MLASNQCMVEFESLVLIECSGLLAGLQSAVCTQQAHASEQGPHGRRQSIVPCQHPYSRDILTVLAMACLGAQPATTALQLLQALVDQHYCFVTLSAPAASPMLHKSAVVQSSAVVVAWPEYTMPILQMCTILRALVTAAALHSVSADRTQLIPALQQTLLGLQPPGKPLHLVRIAAIAPGPS